MSLSIAEVKSSLEASFHGVTIAKVTNFFAVANRAARRVLADIDPAETMRVVPFSSPFYSSVYDYPAPSDLKGNRIVDIRPQTKDRLGTGFMQTYGQTFDFNKGNVYFGTLGAVQWNTGVKTLRISVPGQAAVEFASTAEVTGWSSSGEVAYDPLTSFENMGSVRLSLDQTAGEGTIIWQSYPSVIDITAHQDGSIFIPVYIRGEDTGRIESIEVMAGNSLVYYPTVVTSDFSGQDFHAGWNIIQARLENIFNLVPELPQATSLSEISLLRIKFNLAEGSSVFNVNIGTPTLQTGELYEIVYYSNCLFRSSVTGAFKEKATLDSDLINLDTDSYEVFYSCLAWMLSQQLQGLNSAVADGTHFREAYLENLARYQMTHRSEVTPPVTSYYEVKPSRPHRYTRVYR